MYQGDGLYLYAYCGNNPVLYYDPSGYAETPLSDDGCPPDAKIGENGNNGDDERGSTAINVVDKFVDGSSMETDGVLDLATEFLGKDIPNQFREAGALFQQMVPEFLEWVRMIF